jgi:hypothetical protein
MSVAENHHTATREDGHDAYDMQPQRQATLNTHGNLLDLAPPIMIASPN